MFRVPLQDLHSPERFAHVGAMFIKPSCPPAPALARRGNRAVFEFLIAYICLFAVLACLGRWTPDYLAGRSLWHFTISRMVVPLIALGALAAWALRNPSAILLASLLGAIGRVSAIKRNSVGEPFETSDIFLAGQ